MGLKNNEDNYYRITHVDVSDSRVHIEVFVDQNVSNRKLTAFEKKGTDSVHCGKLTEELAKFADAKETIKDNLWAAGYLALKNEPPFNVMTNVLEAGQ